MPSSPLAQFSKNAPRFKKIVGTMLKYGLANRIKENDPQFVKGLPKSSNGSRITDMSPETRLRMALTSDIKPPLLVVDPERFYRSGEKWAVD